ASITSASPDPNLADNTANLDLTVSPIPLVDLSVGVSGQPSRINPAEVRSTSILIFNSGSSAAHDVRIVATPISGASIAGFDFGTRNPFTCSVTDGLGVCTAATIAPRDPLIIGVRFVAPDRDDGGNVGVQVDITSADVDGNPANNRATGLS